MEERVDRELYMNRNELVSKIARKIARGSYSSIGNMYKDIDKYFRLFPNLIEECKYRKNETPPA